MRFDLSGRQALVTGSTRGIGRAILLGLAEHGAAVAVHGHADGSAGSATSQEALHRGAAAAACLTADLTQPGAARRLAADAAAALGSPLDIVIANVSAEQRAAWDEITREDGRAQLELNLLATLELIQATAPAMRERRWGRIVTVGSVQEVRPHPQMLIYAGTKAALANMARNLAAQLAPFGVTVNNLAPGAIATERNAQALADPDYRRAVEGHIPAGRIGEPDDCAGAAVLLCSDAGRYITGVDLRVDGGMHLP